MIGSAGTMVSGLCKIGKDELAAWQYAVNEHAVCRRQRCIPIHLETCRCRPDPEKVVSGLTPKTFEAFASRRRFIAPDEASDRQRPPQHSARPVLAG
jgi:hypothetical protein